MAKSIKAQLSVIAHVMGKAEPDVPYYVFTFGKHKGQTLSQVMNEDKPYLLWLTTVDTIPPRLRKILFGVLNIKDDGL